MTNQNPHIKFTDEPQDLTTYTYISNHIHFEYFVGYEISSLLGYKNTQSVIKNNVSKCNQLPFREYPGIKVPPLNPKTILITRDGACEILLKTRKRISPDVAFILKKFGIETTNRKCLSKEQLTLSEITNLFKTEIFEDQYKVGPYFLDLYFPEYKIIVECDENGHSDRDENKEKERMEYINLTLGVDDGHWIRYNPDEKDFDMTKVMGRILLSMKVKGKIPMRKCAGCKIVKPATEYHKSSYQPMGIEYNCKVCRSEKNKKRLKKKKMSTPSISVKICGMCEEKLDISNFWKSCGNKDGYYKLCKECGKDERYKQQKRFTKTDNKFKKCNKCSILKTIDNFGFFQASSDGLQHRCKLCQRDDRRERKERKKLQQSKKILDNKG